MLGTWKGSDVLLEKRDGMRNVNYVGWRCGARRLLHRARSRRWRRWRHRFSQKRSLRTPRQQPPPAVCFRVPQHSPRRPHQSLRGPVHGLRRPQRGLRRPRHGLRRPHNCLRWPHNCLRRPTMVCSDTTMTCSATAPTQMDHHRSSIVWGPPRCHPDIEHDAPLPRSPRASNCTPALPMRSTPLESKFVRVARAQCRIQRNEPSLSNLCTIGRAPPVAPNQTTVQTPHPHSESHDFVTPLVSKRKAPSSAWTRNGARTMRAAEPRAFAEVAVVGKLKANAMKIAELAVDIAVAAHRDGPAACAGPRRLRHSCVFSCSCRSRQTQDMRGGCVPAAAARGNRQSRGSPRATSATGTSPTDTRPAGKSVRSVFEGPSISTASMK